MADFDSAIRPYETKISPKKQGRAQLSGTASQIYANWAISFCDKTIIGSLKGYKMIQFKCVYCGEEMEAPQSLAGEKLDCPSCSHRIPVPRPKNSSGSWDFRGHSSRLIRINLARLSIFRDLFDESTQCPPMQARLPVVPSETKRNSARWPYCSTTRESSMTRCPSFIFR